METEAPTTHPYPLYPFFTEEEVIELHNLRSGEFRWLQVHRGLRPKKYTDDGATPLFWAGDLTASKLGRKPQDWEVHFDLGGLKDKNYCAQPFVVSSDTASRIILGKQRFILIRALFTPAADTPLLPVYDRHAVPVSCRNLPYCWESNQYYGWMQETYAEVSPGCEPYYKSESDDKDYWADIEACEGNKLEWKPANQMPIENSRVLVLWEPPVLFCPQKLIESEEKFKRGESLVRWRIVTDVLTNGGKEVADVLHERFGDNLPAAAWCCELHVVKRLLTNRQLAIIGEPIK